jgi:hypothetical protein
VGRVSAWAGCTGLVVNALRVAKATKIFAKHAPSPVSASTAVARTTCWPGPRTSLPCPKKSVALEAAPIFCSAVGMRLDIRQTLAQAAARKLHCGSQPRARGEINEIFAAMRCGQLLGRLVLTP